MTTDIRSDHHIRIEYASFDVNDLEELEVDVLHPDGCDSTNCPLKYLEESVGLAEGLGLQYYSRRNGCWTMLFDEPAFDLIEHAFSSQRLTIPIEFEFTIGFDSYSGEYDEDLTWRPIEPT